MRTRLFSVTIKDCRVDTFTVGGPGGGGKDTSQTGRRVTHLASSAVGQATDTRSGEKNRRLAFERMAATPKFRTWVRTEAARLSTGKTVDQIVDEMMEPQNLRFETKDDKNRWVVGQRGASDAQGHEGRSEEPPEQQGKRP